ncbi:hypothetical protein G3M58_26915 [Streptomyces sp. SID7499]|uniref:Secreted protein n=1 Tax=Streptomyces sp. SID7499 TaxID=2706086 RepID=A0A6G3WX00_9ACTN|nr:hypothetical protein [Streptomyces sp. SID7499]
MVVGALAVVMGLFAWLATVVRRRGLAGSGFRAAMASYEEAFRVTAHDSHYEIQAQARAESSAAAPGDPWRPTRDDWSGAGGARRPRPRSGLRRRLGAWQRRVARGR